MADHREQVKPLALAASFQSLSDDEEALSKQWRLKKRRYIQCCGCVAALLLILAVVAIVLSFTVFRIENPRMRMNGLTIQNLDQLLQNGNLSLRTDVNVTLLADVSVKNPNAVTFRFHNSSTSIYYGGSVVGEGIYLQGKAKARRTLRRNVTVDIMPGKLLAVPTFESDFASRALNISSYTRISGRVKILNCIKKNIVVTFNCSMTFRFSASGQDFYDQRCRPQLDGI